MHDLQSKNQQVIDFGRFKLSKYATLPKQRLITSLEKSPIYTAFVWAPKRTSSWVVQGATLNHRKDKGLKVGQLHPEKTETSHEKNSRAFAYKQQAIRSVRYYITLIQICSLESKHMPAVSTVLQNWINIVLFFRNVFQTNGPNMNNICLYWTLNMF